MSNRRRSQGIRGKYAFIMAHRSEFDTAVMCRLLDVSRSGFYEWLRKPLSDRALAGQRLLSLIRAAYTASHGVYGASRIFLDLREAGETCSQHRVARIMRANNMNTLHGYRAPQYARGHTSLLTPNTLQRDITVQRPNKAWVTDITYIRTAEHWVYLCVVLDWYSGLVVGWSMSPREDRQLVVQAVLRAVWQRPSRTPVMLHSDRDCQFTSEEDHQVLAAPHITCSMSAVGRCADIVAAERFFGVRKRERVNRRRYR